MLSVGAIEVTSPASCCLCHAYPVGSPLLAVYGQQVSGIDTGQSLPSSLLQFGADSEVPTSNLRPLSRNTLFITLLHVASHGGHLSLPGPAMQQSVDPSFPPLFLSPEFF